MMKKITSLSEAQNKVLRDLRVCIKRIHDLTQAHVETVKEGIAIIRAIRTELYEDLNQIQHEEMILRAIDYLQKKEVRGSKIEWNWNPRQTGSGDEPDLVGRENDCIVISAEITTSEKPVGVLDKRMKATLDKLNKMKGRKYYFVRTSIMENRALTKIEKSKHSIEVRKI